jgi:hypothetical protein
LEEKASRETLVFTFWKGLQKAETAFSKFRQISKSGLTKNCGAGMLKAQQC